MAEESTTDSMPATPPVSSKPTEKPFKLIASDFILLGIICAYVAPLFTLFVCIFFSWFLRVRRQPKFQPTMRILNEIIATNTSTPIANFIAPLLPEQQIRWVMKENGTIPVPVDEP